MGARGRPASWHRSRPPRSRPASRGGKKPHTKGSRLGGEGQVSGPGPEGSGTLGGYSRLLGVHRAISFPKRGPPRPQVLRPASQVRVRDPATFECWPEWPPQLASGGLSVPSQAPVHLSMEDTAQPRACTSDWPAEPCPAGLLCRPVLASGEWRWLALDAEEELALRVDSAIGEQSAGPGRLSGRHPRGRRLCPLLCLRVAAPNCDPTGLSHMSKWPGVRAAV